MDTIRNRVRELREERGLSQSELARRTGVTRQTIISLEKGSYVPSLLFALNLRCSMLRWRTCSARRSIHEEGRV